MADYKLKRIPKYMKAMVFLTFPHTQSYFFPLNKIEPQNQSWWKQRCSGGGDLTGSSSASETSKGEMRCKPNLSSQGCQPMEKHQNILEFTKHHKKMKIYDCILKRNKLWGIEDGSALRAQLFAWHELLRKRRMARITKRGRGRPGEQELPSRYHHPS